MDNEKVLDLGCGARKRTGSIGLDRVALAGVDIVHDLDHFPYPLSDSSFDRIILRHVVEHVSDVVALMEEIHRIGRPGAIVEIYTPHFTSASSFSDPTHKHHFSLLTFDFFCGATDHGYVHKAKYEIIKRNVEFWSLHDKIPFVPYHWLGIRWFVHRHPIFYERFLCFLFPIQEFHVFLSIIKS